MGVIVPVAIIIPVAVYERQSQCATSTAQGGCSDSRPYPTRHLPTTPQELN